jgi:AcrR family transcriptional regulator
MSSRAKRGAGAEDAVPSESGIGRRRKAAAKESREAYSQKRQEVIQAAAHVFQEKGFQAATLSDVAEGLGADRASIYYYASGKTELLGHVVSYVLDDLLVDAAAIATSSDLPEEKLRRLTARLVSGFSEHYPYMSVYVQVDAASGRTEKTWSPELRRQRAEIERHVRSVLQEGVDAEVFRSDLSMQIVLNAYFGMVNWTYRWFSPKDSPSPHEIAETYMELILAGLRRPK